MRGDCHAFEGHAPQWQRRHMDRMQFETILAAQAAHVPRTKCP
ncbi:MAG: hypothetical protein NTX48_14070 [Planctomycetales bacterium]|nr:hypothetical protein [Planctomycetales bacterium]